MQCLTLGPYHIASGKTRKPVLQHDNSCVPGANENAVINGSIEIGNRCFCDAPKPRIGSNVNFGMARELRLRYIRGSDLGAVRSGIVAPVTRAIEDKQAFSKRGSGIRKRPGFQRSDSIALQRARSFA